MSRSIRVPGGRPEAPRAPTRGAALPAVPAALLSVLLSVAIVACGDFPGDGRTISREEFVAAFVDLRREAFLTPAGVLRRDRHEEILARHGVTADDLNRFVEAHARDVPRMSAIWAEIEALSTATLQDEPEEEEEAPAEGAGGASEEEAPSAPSQE